jgi:carbon monoxide dehydrogenase subunit G
MTKIESDLIMVNRTDKEVYSFLTDLSNYKQLMPERVSEFEADEKNAKLKIDGMGKVNIELGSCTEYSTISLNPSGNMPFSFTMHWEIESNEDGKTRLVGYVNAELNMMLKMLAQGPLKEFINTQAHKLKEIMEKSS